MFFNALLLVNGRKRCIVRYADWEKAALYKLHTIALTIRNVAVTGHDFYFDKNELIAFLNQLCYNL